MGARQHTDLEVWKLADELRKQLAVLVASELRRVPWLADQLQGAANSACANIAEGFARYQPRDFARYLRIARGSLAEIAEHLREPVVISKVPGQKLQELQRLTIRASSAAAKLILYLQAADAPRTGNPER